MNAFMIALTIYAAPVAVADASAVPGTMALVPVQTIMFYDTTDKKTLADCVRVQKALTASKLVAFCGVVEASDQ